jgi:uncharacterized protein YdcH (DUF465 family)
LFRRTSKDEVKLPTGPGSWDNGSARQLHLRRDARMDKAIQEELKAHLMQTNETFRDLMNQHHEYDALVARLESKPVLTAAEEIEEHRLKKLKLQLKDQMEHLVSEYRLQHVS